MRKSSKAILLVEDEVIIAMTEKMELEKQGYEVTIAHSGKEAVKIAKTTPGIDLILMDIDLGRGMDGTEAAEAILKEREVPVVFLSSHTEKEIVNKTEKITSYGYIAKDSGSAVLGASMKMAFKLFEARVELKWKNQELDSTNEKMQATIEELERANEELRVSGEALQESETKFAALFQFSPIPISVLTMDGRHVETNLMFLKLSGYSHEEVIGRTNVELNVITRETRERMFAAIKQGGGSIREYEHEGRARDGTIHTLLTSTETILIKGVPHLLNANVDITDSKHAQKARQEGEALLAQSQQIAHIGSWIFNIAENRLIWSDETYRIFGLEPQEFASTYGAFLDSVHPDDRAAVDAAYSDSLREAKDTFEIEHRVLRQHTGEIRYVHEKCIHERDAAGTIVRSIGMVQDITEHKHVQEKLQESEERLRLAHKATNDVVWDWDVVTDAQRWNEAGAVVFGWTEIVGRPVTAAWWVERVHPEDLRRVEDGFFAVVNNPQADYWKDEYRFRKADGSYAQVMDRGYVLRNKQGKAIRMIGAMLDITERKQAEERIRDLLQEKELILKEVHHRIKNNMHIIRSLISLQANSTKDRTVTEALNDAVNRMQSMAVLYDKLYRSEDFQDMSIKDYLAPLVREIVSLFPKGETVKVETSIDDFILDVKTLSSLGIIVNEIITNAMKYAFIGRADGIISIAASKSNNRVKMTISDNGPGIPAGVIAMNSEGLGLQLVEMLVKQLRGSLIIEREQGTKCIIEFTA